MKSVIAILLAFICYSYSHAEVLLEERILADGLRNPWEIVMDADGFIYFTERIGTIKRIHPVNGQIKQLLKINDVFQNNEGGLLGMALHPNFPVEPFIYCVYNYRGSGNSTLERLVRYEYSNDTLSNQSVFLENIPGAAIHNGSRIAFLDGKIIMTTGDAAIPSLALDLSSLAGKVLRINADGSIPDDNPFPNSYVYSFGHRNAQGLTLIDEKIFISEHGPSTDDEINIIIAGGNYGWNKVHGYCDGNISGEIDYCNQNETIEPILSLTPDFTLAPAGMDYYDHPSIPEWRNSLLLTTLKAQKLIRLELDKDQKTILKREDIISDKYGRLRDVLVTTDGRILLATSNNSNDRIIELSPKIVSVKDESLENHYKVEIYTSSIKFHFVDAPNRITIFNLFGEEVVRISDLFGNDYEIPLPEQLKSGIYFASFVVGSKTVVKKFVIAN